ncbi:hypothetical protein Cgig2_014354 [Carnegiea gigantea]|uniref:Zinc knuckle CX2CX4HX4C domain-containing protein n=1 Tax=Carnegiea gigantea TaxID=171969 RepID=A0A9Q1QIW3_9CARY|nr:hypothetical protein Cgig2_014354 [Carnegiea gigantea]
MNSPLVNCWKDLRLTEGKEKVVNCSYTSDDNFTTRASLALAGRFLTNKPYWVSGLFAFLQQAWKVRRPFRIWEIDENLFVFQFFVLEDRNRVNIQEPLSRGAIATFGDAGAKWVPFKYEKLPNFCYRCGQLTHVEYDFNEDEDEDTKGQYGNWLRASPIKIYISNKNKNTGSKAKLFANLLDKGKSPISGWDKEGQKKLAARKSLKDILEAANSVTKESFGESKKGNGNVDVEVTTSKSNDMVLHESSNMTGLDRVHNAGGDKRVGENKKEGVGDSSGVATNVQRKWKRHKPCSTQDGGSVMSRGSKRGKRKEVEGQDAMDSIQLMEVENVGKWREQTSTTLDEVASDFMAVLDRRDLHDIGYNGYHFMWNNVREYEEHIEERLDQFMCNDE